MIEENAQYYKSISDYIQENTKNNVTSVYDIV